jgi:Ca2+:H+ antiporter
MLNKLKNLTTNDAVSLISFLVFLSSFFISFNSAFWIALAATFLAAAISAAVHNAEVIAEKLGPSMGTLILALSVTVIEVALIVNLMGNGSEGGASIARDTVYATIMIVTNGIIGFCILLGGLKHKELGFQSIGTSSLLSVLAVLSAVTLVLPNFTVSTVGPTYGPSQLIFVSVASIFLYGALVWAQTKSHKSFFEALSEQEKKDLENSNLAPSNFRALVSFVGLVVSLIAVVGLAKILSPTIESVVASLGAPKSVVGIIIALLVLGPETFAAVNAAKTNQLQTSLNLALGSGAASIALTIPAVSIYSLVTSSPLNLGLDGKSMIFLILTFIAASFTFGNGKTTALNGVTHLVILASYIAMAFMP